MKKFLTIFVIAIIAVVFNNVYAQQQVYVGIEVTEEIDEDTQEAETESAVVSHDVFKDGKLVIAAGTPVVLNIERTKHRGLGVPGTLTMKPVSTVDVNNQIIPLTGESKNDTGKNRKGAAIACGVVFGIIWFPVGLLWLCMKGGNAAFPAGTQMIGVATLN